MALHVKNVCKVHCVFKEHEIIFLNALSCLLLTDTEKVAVLGVITLVLTQPNSPKLPLMRTFLETDYSIHLHFLMR